METSNLPWASNGGMAARAAAAEVAAAAGARAAALVQAPMTSDQLME